MTYALASGERLDKLAGYTSIHFVKYFSKSS